MAIIYEKKDKIAYITVNRPEAMNSFDPETFDEIGDALEDFDADDSVLVAILTGAGEKAFCVGSDLKKTMPPVGQVGRSVAAEFWKKGWQIYQPESLYQKLEAVRKPIIAAINGYCLAGGLEMAIRCDLRVASENAVFSEPETQVGSLSIGKWLSQVMPLPGAMKMFLTASRINAQQALQWGLVTDVVPLPELMPTAERIARRIADNAPLSVQATKVAVMSGLTAPLEKGILVENLLFGMLQGTEDRIEGRRAFAEKRKPAYKGR